MIVCPLCEGRNTRVYYRTGARGTQFKMLLCKTCKNRSVLKVNKVKE